MNKRCQRNSIVLRDVEYIIEAVIYMSEDNIQKVKNRDKKEGRTACEPIVKYREMFNRRLKKGQCWHQPYLGTREFSCDFFPVTQEDEDKAIELNLTYPIGSLLFDIWYDKDHNAGSMLVSYNTNAFESYSLKGNLNSGICTNCARNYIEALKFLTTNGIETLNSKEEKEFKYTNRQKISDDTIALFWTKVPDDNIDPWSDICQPTVERIKKMFSSVATGDSLRAGMEIDNYFYCCTLSSAAARIAVRDWLAISVSQYQNNLKQWFEDIATIKNGEVYYPGINSILYNCIKKKAKPTQSDFKAKARIGTILWYAALTNTPLPLMILQSVLSQIEHDKAKYGCFSEEKSTVIRLVLNRNNKNKYNMKNELDEQNASKAYLCGRLFALICKLQFKAQGEVNSSIKDRFFASASNTPARIMGILLTKYVPVYEKKTKGAYSKSITEIAARIGHFPNKFSIVERGEFALGYYYQYNTNSNKMNNDSNNFNN